MSVSPEVVIILKMESRGGLKVSLVISLQKNTKVVVLLLFLGFPKTRKIVLNGRFVKMVSEFDNRKKVFD